MKRIGLAALATLLLACGGDGLPYSGFRRLGQTLCAAIAQEYRAALDEAMACNVSTPGECITGGATYDTAIPGAVSGPDGITDGLCFCPPGPSVTASGKATLDPIVARYRSAGCSGACPCPAPVDPGTYVAVCAAQAGGAGRCTVQYGATP